MPDRDVQAPYQSAKPSLRQYQAGIPHTRHADGDEREGRSLAADGSNCEELFPHGHGRQSFQPAPSASPCDPSLVPVSVYRLKVVEVVELLGFPFSSVPGQCRTQGALLELQGRILPGGPAFAGVARFPSNRAERRQLFAPIGTSSQREVGGPGRELGLKAAARRPARGAGRAARLRCWNECLSSRVLGADLARRPAIEGDA